jgi:ribose-phosphate pyrophosphokinase
MELLVGDVANKVRLPFRPSKLILHTMIQVAILVDDMIDTGKTLVLAAHTLRSKGARAVYALISHGLSLIAQSNLLLVIKHLTIPRLAL